MFNFTPLLGAQAESAASQSLLELDGGIKVLVDVGWDAAFDAQRLDAIERQTSTLSLVLLTHATTEHLGAYAHCCKHIPLFSKVPVYATTPVINLGRTLLLDLYASSPLAASIIHTSSISSSSTTSKADSSPNLLLQPPTPEEIATYFASINALKYSQPHQPVASSWSPALGGLTITAYGAGHTLGGTVWHIQQGLESIVYAADWNQGRENLLPGAALLSGGQEIIEPLQRPTALICSSKGVEKAQSQSRKDRDGMLLSLVRDTIAQGGKVLIPTDSSARMLELAFLLNEAWKENLDGPHAATYRSARVYMASKSGSASIRYLQSMLEWVEESVRAEAEAHLTKTKGSTNPLNWQHVKLVERNSTLERAVQRSQPCVFLASDASLEWGFSRLALESLATDTKNLVILTEKSAPGSPPQSSISRQLWDLWQSRQGQGHTSSSGARLVDTDGTAIGLQEASTAPLSDAERALYETYITRQRQLHSTMQGDNTLADATAPDVAEQQDEEESESEDEDEDAEHQGRALNLSAQMTQSSKRKAALSDAELGVNVLLRGKSVHDYDVRNKRGREKMFPFVAHRTRNDEFGDLIKPEEYLRAEERDEVNGVDMRDGNKEDLAVGKKRKWDDASTSGPKATGESAGNKAQNGTPGDGSDEDEESDYEPEELMPEGPQKVVFTSRSLALRLRIAHVDFAGLHDLRALQMIIPLMRPRKLILISGERSETQTLASECRRLLTEGTESAGTDIFTPAEGEVVDASVDTNAWTLKLSRQLVKKLTWQNVKGLGVVALTGRLDAETAAEDAVKEEEENAKKKVKLESGNDELVKPARSMTATSVPILDLPNSTANAAQQHQRVTQPVHVGDMRLADLRQALRGAGHEADFRGEGTLLVDQAVIVRKSASGRIEIESAARGLQQPEWRTRENTGSFYAVRNAIYSGLAVVAGV
ncbi:hypothetical protein BAUCODRAFT_71003 [Baudoinia panamericana UAMH 10762]|uniref:Cleavage and polyadenylation specificity factor subunit 2 n=1 Tax=Baudoinia panamericana (strain UAMH 10762) TaxID=717646 RepID=M2MGE4_BAUPA|nr:uncharacterized protein BAUCODRAFT_71003 [Baudoinia panamericana UAMH 10762]EMC95701.1 hypothetical protein BAUCODRAFT_71003 [Baudoinia panamericana UAMH 10762]